MDGHPSWRIGVDPFLGSGTTLAASELTERVCYGLEIDPRYLDVIITRRQKLARKQATLEGDGRTFDQIAAAGNPTAYVPTKASDTIIAAYITAPLDWSLPPVKHQEPSLSGEDRIPQGCLDKLAR